MNETIHLFEEHVYLIKNHAVARNPMFAENSLQSYFIKRMKKYLSPISDILAYCLKDNEFQILVKLKDRRTFEDHFKSLQKRSSKKLKVIPESTYIFSQAMSNLQVSFVKHFNWKYGRSGTLMARRFSRKLVESFREMEMWIEKLNRGTRSHCYTRQWINDIMNSEKAMTNGWYVGADFQGVTKIEDYLIKQKINLVDRFSTLPPKRIASSKNYFKYKINTLFYSNPPPF